MIVFDLKCRCGCQFEGWFENRSAFEHQCGDGLITCPQCGSDEIHKILSPVAFHCCTSCDPVPVQPTEYPATAKEMALNFLLAVQEVVEKNYEDVGPNLAKESLKIHYGVSEPKNIRGVTTADEENMLKDEGIELLKIPMIKKSSDPEFN